MARDRLKWRLTSEGIAICFASFETTQISMHLSLQCHRGACHCLPQCGWLLKHIPWVCRFLPPGFSSACDSMMCIQGGCQTFSRLRLQKSIRSAKLSGASSLSGAVLASPTLKALNILRLWNLAVDTNRGRMSFKKQMCAFLWQDTGSSLPRSVLYLMFSEESRFLRSIEHMLLGCHCACVCIISRRKRLREGIVLGFHARPHEFTESSAGTVSSIKPRRELSYHCNCNEFIL